MKESVIYREIQQEAEARGQARGEARGEAKKQQEIALNLLREGLPLEIVARATGLSIEQMQQLQQQIGDAS